MRNLLIPLLCLPLLFNWQALEVVKLKTFDAFIQTPAPSGYFVTLDITEEDIRNEGGWPLPRQRLAEIQEELVQKGALGVGWVFSFIDQDRLGGDAVFVNYLKSDIPTVVATFEYNNQIFPQPTGTVTLGELPTGVPLEGYLPNIPEISAVALEGMVSAKTDVDNLVRRLPLLLQTPDGWIPSFGTQVLKVLAGADTFIIKGSEAGIEEIKVPGLPETQVDSLGRQWLSWVATPRTTLAEMDVTDKFVFVGVTAKGVMPQVATPVGLVYPHYVQAALAESMLVDSPQIPALANVYQLVSLVIILVLLTLIIRYLPVVASGVGVVSLYAVVAGVAVWFIRQNILIDFTYSLISMTFIAVQEFWLRFGEQYKLRLQIKKQFEHYLDPRQVKQLQDNPDMLKLGGEKKYCTFLFTDIRGFTSLSERLSPEEVTKIVNKVLTLQVECIQKHGGMVDKFIGDACMAIFNAPIDLVGHQRAAVDCAREIRTRMATLNLGIKIGIGLNTGVAIVGNMGSSTRFDYSAIGDAVNVAARLESATKLEGVDVLIGEQTAVHCDDLIQHKAISVKGKEELLKTYKFEES
jgi:adenylate cyclase